MIRIIWIITVLLITLPGSGAESGMAVIDPDRVLTGSDHSSSAPSSDATREKVQYLLTRQGLVQEGVMETGDKTVYVRLPKQKGGITISRLDVLCIADTKEELFEYRKSQIGRTDTGELIKLADWGVRHQLTASAVRMLEEVITTEKDASIRDMLTKKIEQMKFVEKIRQDALKRKASSSVEPGQEASHAENLLKIEQWGKTIPMAVQERFLRKVQPILFRHCSSEGCHRESNKSLDFVLHQSLTRSSKRVNALKNLQSVLSRIDLSSPESSPILSHPPITDRRGKPRYPFGNTPDSLKDYEVFISWVKGLPAHISPDSVRNAGQTVPEAGTTSPQGNKGRDSKELTEAASPLPVTESQSAIIRSGTGLTADGQKYLERQQAAKEEKGRHPSAPVVIKPKDEFDPVLFNRRYHPEKFK